MVISALGSLSATVRHARLPARDAPEHRADGHPDPRQIAFAQNISRHDFARREDVGAGGRPSSGLQRG